MKTTSENTTENTFKKEYLRIGLFSFFKGVQNFRGVHLSYTRAVYAKNVTNHESFGINRKMLTFSGGA